MSSLSISDLRNVLTGLSETNSKSESTANDTGTEKREGVVNFAMESMLLIFGMTTRRADTNGIWV